MSSAHLYSYRSGIVNAAGEPYFNYRKKDPSNDVRGNELTV